MSEKETSVEPPVDIAAKISNLIEKIAQKIEDGMGCIATIKATGGPYESSRTIQCERKLRETAAEVLRTIIEDPDFRS